MPNQSELGVAISFIFGASFAWIPCYIIRGYLKNKPFGFQTLLDRVAVDLTYVLQFGALNFFLGIAIGFLVR